MSLIDGIYWQNVYDNDKPKEKIPETNYQHVIRKTPEELADWLTDTDACPADISTPYCLGQDCKQCWLEWLNKEEGNG